MQHIFNKIKKTCIIIYLQNNYQKSNATEYPIRKSTFDSIDYLNKAAGN